jgi:hypothetical protein
MAVVVFDIGLFLGRYPEFTAANAANPARLPALFSEAGLYLANTDSSIVSDVTKRALLLNMLTAHISYINGDLSVDGQTRPVGRMTQASEGSVSASFEGVPPTPGSGAWFAQSQYGAAFWQATSSLRSFRYFVRCPRPL